MSSRQIQLRRGTAAAHNSFTGVVGEITMDTTNNTLHVHDGKTPGGTILAKQNELDMADFVIESQLPSAQNNYTWYRKYKSGWVEQGGYADGTVNLQQTPVALPVTMANSRYTIAVAVFNDHQCYVNIEDQTTTGFKILEQVFTTSWWFHNYKGYWHVSGVAASA